MDKQPRTGSPKQTTLHVAQKNGEQPAAALARTTLRPSVRAAVTSRTYSQHQFGELDLMALVDELATQNEKASKGEMGRAEGMLMAQAHTLEAIFHELARRAALNMGEYINAAERYMRLALKAQSQCRATLETLATIKNPSPVTFVRQANVAHGPQQVNNGQTADAATSRARESENQPNKLLEQPHDEQLDSGALHIPVGADSALEAVGEVHRPANVAG